MAKKSQAGRPSGAKRPTATVARRPQATLAPVKPTVAEPTNGNGNGAGAATATVVVAPVEKRVTPVVTTKAAANAKVAQAKANAAASAVRSGQSAVRKAAQQVNPRRSLIRAENYSYVTRDLRLIGVVAFLMFAFMIVLRITMH